MRKLAHDFKDFIVRGNVVDLAVAVVVGAAFSAVVASFVKNLLTPLIALAAGKADFSKLQFSLGSTAFTYGNFLNDLITFVSTAFVVFFFVVKPINKLLSLRKVQPAEAPVTKECPECLSNIPLKAKRCSFCTSEVALPA
jgi:large conductance mechanosensitive channel